jgi:hypothetical protein
VRTPDCDNVDLRVDRKASGDPLTVTMSTLGSGPPWIVLAVSLALAFRGPDFKAMAEPKSTVGSGPPWIVLAVSLALAFRGPDFKAMAEPKSTVWPRTARRGLDFKAMAEPKSTVWP